MNNKIILIKNQSDSIKGILILLIILGHNFMLANYASQGRIFTWTYSFHVTMFFIIPFLYDKKEDPIRQTIKKTARKLLIPFVWFYLLSFTLYYIHYHPAFNTITFIKGLIPLNTDWIPQAAGVQYLWFCPVFFMFTIIKNIFPRLNKHLKCVLLSISAICFCIVKMNSFFCKEIYCNLIIASLSYIFISWLTIKLYHSISKDIYKYIAIVFGIYSILILSGIRLPKIINHLILPITFLSILYLSRNYLCKSKILIAIGKLSFPIYMVHFFVNIIFEMTLKINLINGIISYILTVLICYFMITLFKKTTLYKIVFP